MPRAMWALVKTTLPFWGCFTSQSTSVGCALPTTIAGFSPAEQHSLMSPLSARCKLNNACFPHAAVQEEARWFLQMLPQQPSLLAWLCRSIELETLRPASAFLPEGVF